MDKTDRIKKLENLLQDGKISKKEFDVLIQKINDTSRKVTLAPKDPKREIPVTPIAPTQNKINWRKPLIVLLSLVVLIVTSIILFYQIQTSGETDISKTNTKSELSTNKDTSSYSSSEQINDEPDFSEDETENTVEEITEEIIMEEEKVEVVEVAEEVTTTKAIKSKEISEFKTFQSLNNVKKISYFIKDIIPLKYTKSLSSSESSKLNTFLKESFDALYENHTSFTESEICDYLSTFKSESKMAGISLDSQKISVLNKEGDCN